MQWNLMGLAGFAAAALIPGCTNPAAPPQPTPAAPQSVDQGETQLMVIEGKLQGPAESPAGSGIWALMVEGQASVPVDVSDVMGRAGELEGQRVRVTARGPTAPEVQSGRSILIVQKIVKR